MAKKWQKVEMNPTWDFEKDKELIGVYISKEENVGPNGSTIYNIQTEDGSTVGMWGSTLLDNRFKNIVIGEEIRVVYLGSAKSEKTGREYKNFEVYRIADTEIKSDKGDDSEEIPF